MSSYSRPTCKDERPVDCLAAVRGEAATLRPLPLASDACTKSMQGDAMEQAEFMEQLMDGVMEGVQN